ncbi:MAG: putative toxin-antitoxin system toxin component, PIN family [Muribaculaceae bacterium]|nr:putative toxin-antitoxin system toxin component, PIN family [Muribaculaceae bacterium]
MKGDKIYAVIDTNVLVSSLFSIGGASNPSRVIEAVLNGYITPVYNDDIIAEYRDVLSRDKFKFNSALIDDFLAIFIDFGITSVPKKAYEEQFPDEDDIVFYEIALSIEDTYLVTGITKHFPVKPYVVTPTQMVEILRKKGFL